MDHIPITPCERYIRPDRDSPEAYTLITNTDEDYGFLNLRGHAAMWELFDTALPRRCRHCAELMMLDWAGVLLCGGGCDAADPSDPPCDCDMSAEEDDVSYVEINIEEMAAASDPYLYFQALIREVLRRDDDD